MEIKNYIVENRELFFDYLEKELCQNGISYVRINNEIHFLNQIIRLYDFELDKRLIINFMFSKINEERHEIIRNIESLSVDYVQFGDIETFINNQKNSPLLKNVSQSAINFYEIEDISKMKNNHYTIPKSFQLIDKSIQKQESTKVNQKLKMYKK